MNRNTPPNPLQLPGNAQFLWMATVFEGGLMGLAFVLGWLFDLDPVATLAFEPGALALGLAGTLPLFALFALAYSFPRGSLAEIKHILVDRLGPLLGRASGPQLCYLALLAGWCEEILFRGLVQVWLERDWGWWGGLVFSNLIFALVHWVTPMYGLLAGLTGVYLGAAMDITGERNLLIPIVIHWAYDFLAFLAVAQTYRKRRSG